MFELLYAVGIVFKAFELPGLRVLSTVVEWRMVCWLSLRMADGTGRDKTLATDLKNGQLVPGGFMDEILLFSVTPRLLSPSVQKLSLPGPWTPITPCAEICESPTQDDGGVPVKGPLEDPQNDDTLGYVSDESVRFHSQFSRYGYAHTLIWIHQDTGTASEAEIDREGFGYRRSSTYDNQRFEIGYRAPLVPPKSLPNLPPVPTDKLTRKVPPLKRVLSRVFLENGPDAVRGFPTSAGVLQLNFT